MSVRNSTDVRRPFDARAIGADAVVGALAGIILGWLDAAQLLLAASSPVLRAAYKVPMHVLWVSPLTAAPVMAMFAVLLGVVARWGLRFRPTFAWRALVFGGVSFVVVFLASWVLRVLHPAAAVLLALGAAVLCSRLSLLPSAGLDRRFRTGLIASILVLPIVALLELNYPRFAERRATGQLPPPAGGDNVIILVLDTVRRDRFYRPDSVVIAPYIEGFGRESRWYSNAWAPSSWSLPSHGTLLTGLLPDEHGADWPRLEFRDDVVPLAQELAQRGVVAGAFSGNDSWVIPEIFGSGFVRFEALTVASARQRSIMGRMSRPIRRIFGLDELSGGMNANALLDHAWEFIRSQSGRPAFVYVCLMDVNRAYYETSYDAPVWNRPVPLAQRVAAYDSALREVDKAVETFIERLRSSGILDRSVIAITSDHGESFGKEYDGDADPAGHGSGLSPEQVRVPMWIRTPGATLTGEDDRPVSLHRLSGTVLRLAGFTDTRPRAVPADSGVANIRLSLRYEGRQMTGRVVGRWLYLTDSASSPPRRDSVALPASTRATSAVAKEARR